MNELLARFRTAMIYIIGLIALALLLVFYPVQKTLEQAALDNYRAEARASLTSLNTFVAYCREQSLALATHKNLNEPIDNYSQGQLTFSALTGATVPYYNDLAGSMENCVTAVRVTGTQTLAYYGDNILTPNDLLAYRFAEITISLYPYHGHPYFLITAPIKLEQRILAYDYLLFDPMPVLKDVTTNIYQYKLLLKNEFAAIKTGGVNIDNSLYVRDSHTFFHQEVKNCDAVFLMSVNNDILFAPARNSTNHMMLIILIIVVAVITLLYLAIFRTARDMVTGLQDYNNDIEAEKARIEKLASGQRDLFGIFRSLSGCRSLEDDFKVLTSTLPLLINYQNFVLAARENKTAQFLQIKDTFAGQDPEGTFGRNTPLLDQVLTSGEPYFSGSTHAGFSPGLLHPDVKSIIAVPIIYKGFKWGLIAVDHPEENAFSPHDFQLMVMLAAHIALHLEEMEAKNRLDHQAGRLRLLHELVSRVAMERDNQQLAQLMVDTLTADEKSALAVYQADKTGGSSFILLAAAGKTDLLPFIKDVDPDLMKEVALSHALNISKPEAGGVSRMLAPIVFGESLCGILVMAGNEEFSEGDIDIVWIIINYLATFWEINHLIAKIEREA